MIHLTSVATEKSAVAPLWLTETLQKRTADWLRTGGLIASVLGAVCLSLQTAGAEIIAYEGFDTGGTEGEPISGMAGETSIGFAVNSTWNAGGQGSPLFQSEGLLWNYASGSGLSTTGGALLHTTSHKEENPYQSYAGRLLDTAPSGTLYGSFLLQVYETKGGTGVAGISCVASDSFNVGRTLMFGVDPVAFNATAGTTLAGTASTTTVEVEELPHGSNFLVVFKVTCVGDMHNTAELTMWTLSQAQYESIVSSSNPAEQILNQRTLGDGTDQVHQRLIQTGDLADMSFEPFNAAWIMLSSNNGEFVFDEVRLGTTLNAVSGLPGSLP